jgi:hypothetical protein
MPNFYLVPLVLTTGPNNQQITAPKYAATDLANVSYSSMPYGGEGVALVSLVAPNAALAAEPDVYAFPTDLTQQLASTDVAALAAFVQPCNIPSSWILFGATFQSVLTQLAQIFLCMQAISGGNPVFAGTQNTPQTTLAQAGIVLPASSAFNFSKVNATETIGNFLVSVGQQLNMAPTSVATLTPIAGAVSTTPVNPGNPVTQPVGGLS